MRLWRKFLNDVRLDNSNNFNTILTSTLSDQEKTLKLLLADNICVIAKFIFHAFERRNMLLDSLFIIDSMIDKIDHQEKISTKITSDVENILNKIVSKVEAVERTQLQRRNKVGDIYAIKKVCNNGLKLVLQRLWQWNSWKKLIFNHFHFDFFLLDYSYIIAIFLYKDL